MMLRAEAMSSLVHRNGLLMTMPSPVSMEHYTVGHQGDDVTCCGDLPCGCRGLKPRCHKVLGAVLSPRNTFTAAVHLGYMLMNLPQAAWCRSYQGFACADISTQLPRSWRQLPHATSLG